jgi:hypothetical protein
MTLFLAVLLFLFAYVALVMYHQLPVCVFFGVLGLGCLVKAAIDRRREVDPPTIPPRPSEYGAIETMGRCPSVVVNDTCPICLEETKLDWVCTPCDHRFHYACLFEWLKLNATCPICRTSI